MTNYLRNLFARRAVGILLTAALTVTTVLALAVPHAAASTPTASQWGPASYTACVDEPGLYPCINQQYGIGGSGQFVQVFYRTVYDQDVPSATVYTRFCGPTFGCQWVAHGMQPGQTISLTIVEYRNMPIGAYTSCFELAGYGPYCRTWNVE